MDIYTIALILHVLGASLMLGGNALGFLIIRKNILDLKTVVITKYIGLLSAGGAVAVLLSGFWLFNNDRDAYNSKIVIAKVIIFVVGGMLANLVIKKKVMAAVKSQNEEFLKSEELKTLDAIGFILLLLAVILGVMLTAEAI